MMELNADKVTLGDLLQKNIYVVPQFQREYAWDDEHLDFLWSDVTEALRDDRFHFMGSTLVARDYVDEKRPVGDVVEAKSVRYVIDGQQRLVTLLIFLARLRDRLEAHAAEPAFKDALDEISRLIKARGKRRQGAQRSIERIILNDPLAQATLAYLLGIAEKPKQLKRGRPPAHITRLNHASETLAARLADYEKRGQDLLELVDTLLDQLVFVSLEVGSDSDAFTIFESLNARGEELKVADLVKNLLMGRARRLSQTKRGAGRELSRLVDENWSQTVRTVREGMGERLKNFIRHFWIAEHAFVRETELYQAISEYVRPVGVSSATSAKVLRKFSEELKTAAAQYVWLWGGDADAPYDPGSKFWGARSRLAGIKAFGASQVLPVLLAALRSGIAPTGFEDLCDAVESAVIRRSLAAQPPNEIERETGGWCLRLRESKASAVVVKEICDELLTLAGKGQHEDTFMIATLNSERARHVLLALENVVRKQEGRELFGFDEEKIDVEHVLPQAPSEDKWPAVDWGGDTKLRAHMVGRIGNFALWAQTPNRSLKNARFNCGKAAPNQAKPTCCKRHAYMKSDVVLTKRIATDFERWGTEELIERQKGLATGARAVWPYIPEVGVTKPK